MVCQEELLVGKVLDLYHKISGLESLKPCKHVDTLFTQLVLTCMSPTTTPPIDVTRLTTSVQDIRSKLIRLCGEAECLLETHYSTILNSYENPLKHLHIFPYYSNYLKLGLLEFTILTQHYCTTTHVPSKVAFVGSGPLPLTSIVLATNHLQNMVFHNYDIDPLANSNAQALVASDPDLSKRMVFHTNGILDVSSALKDYDVVCLAALVGMDNEEKNKVIDHLATYMAPGALLMVRSAHGARAFLYPVVDPCGLRGFEVLSVFHPTEEVINSVVIARKYDPVPAAACSSIDQQQGLLVGSMILPNKCSHEIQVLEPLNNHGNMTEELIIEEQLSKL